MFGELYYTQAVFAYDLVNYQNQELLYLGQRHKFLQSDIWLLVAFILLTYPWSALQKKQSWVIYNMQQAVSLVYFRVHPPGISLAKVCRIVKQNTWGHLWIIKFAAWKWAWPTIFMFLLCCKLSKIWCLVFRFLVCFLPTLCRSCEKFVCENEDWSKTWHLMFANLLHCGSLNGAVGVTGAQSHLLQVLN